MNRFDHSIISFLNQFVGRWTLFDKALGFAAANDFIRGGFLSALLWAAWFRSEGEAGDKARMRIAATLAGSVIAILIARAVALMVGFRVRPIADPANGFHFPPTAMRWEGWSAFPSDHAILFFALAVCLFSISSLLGWLALCHAVFVVCLPRVYLGIHHPTDILAGAAWGAAVGWWSGGGALIRLVGARAVRWMHAHPASFYAAFFLFTYELTVVFWDVLFLSKLLVHFLARATHMSV
jgi:undecaprenyl-diphosphatase